MSESSPHPSDERQTSPRLLEDLQGEGEAAWATLLQGYDPLLRRMLRRRGVPDQAADDILQETWQIVVRELRAGGFQHNGRTGAFRAWLKGILRNQVHGAARKRRDDPLLTKVADELSDPNSLSSEILRNENERLIRETLAALQASGRLSAEQVHAFEQIEFEHRSIEELASELKLSYGNVAVWLSRIRRALREKLGPGDQDEM
jgi:RNA polymerase sigma-70 factor, ECF subfamily